MPSSTEFIQEWLPAESAKADLDDDLVALSAVLRECVHGGASVGFILPFEINEARTFWQHRILSDVLSGETRMLVFRVDGKIVGCVQLCLGCMPNQTHKATVSKLLVHPKYRRRGIARRLMERLEVLAREESRTLLVLDTAGPDAESLYVSLGYELAGRIPDFAQNPTNAGLLEATAYYFKRL